MIHGRLEDWRMSMSEEASMKTAFDFLSKFPDGNLESGRHVIEGDRCFVDVHRYATKPLEEGVFESHTKYIDVQYVAAGAERLAARSPVGLKVEGEYLTDADAWLYERPADVDLFTLSAGEFAVFYPEDAHMGGIHPEAGPSKVVKMVVKVRLDASAGE